jgi:two-component system cell cycle sensor histidine kinase/response regulator CckA
MPFSIDLAAMSGVGAWWDEAHLGVCLGLVVVGGVIIAALQVHARRIRNRLLKSEERLRLMLKGSTDAAWDWNALTDEDFYSPRWWEMVGYEEGELPNESGLWKRLLHADDAARAVQVLQTIFQHGPDAYELEYRLRHKAGHYVPVLSRGFVIRDARGQGIRMAGTNTDLTERQRTERARLEGERHLASAQAIAHLGSWSWNLESNTNNWSDENFRIFGYAPQTIKPTYEVFAAALHPDDRDRVLEAAAAAIVTKSSYKVECRIVRPDGAIRQVHCCGEIQLDPAGRPAGMAGTVLDITERKEAEAKREELAAQLLQSQKLETIGQLAGGIAHDFNNLLTAVLGNASLLEIDANLNPRQRSQLAQISQAGARAAELTRQLLLFSRQQSPARREMDLNGTVAEMGRMLERIIGENITLSLIYASEPLYLLADAGMMGQVLLNLAVNARDAMPAGGRLIIQTTTVGVDPAPGSTFTAEPGGPERRLHRRRGEDKVLPPLPQARVGSYACLSVTDEGCGMTPEVLAHIFEPFFTTKEVGRGTGLGLATVYGIVQQHQGWIEVDSQPGQGSSFHIFLPKLEAVRARSAAPFPVKPSAASPGQTILFVEDDPQVSTLVDSVLSHAGYTVIPYESGTDALRDWPRLRDDVDLLITDIVMPGGTNGTALARQLLADRPELRVIFISGYSGTLDLDHVTLAASSTYLGKPFTPDQLLIMVRAQLAEAGTPPA